MSIQSYVKKVRGGAVIMGISVMRQPSSNPTQPILKDYRYA